MKVYQSWDKALASLILYSGPTSYAAVAYERIAAMHADALDWSNRPTEDFKSPDLLQGLALSGAQTFG